MRPSPNVLICLLIHVVRRNAETVDKIPPKKFCRMTARSSRKRHILLLPRRLSCGIDCCAIVPRGLLNLFSSGPHRSSISRSLCKLHPSGGVRSHASHIMWAVPIRQISLLNQLSTPGPEILPAHRRLFARRFGRESEMSARHGDLSGLSDQATRPSFPYIFCTELR